MIVAITLVAMSAVSCLVLCAVMVKSATVTPTLRGLEDMEQMQAIRKNVRRNVGDPMTRSGAWAARDGS